MALVMVTSKQTLSSLLSYYCIIIMGYLGGYQHIRLPEPRTQRDPAGQDAQETMKRGSEGNIPALLA